MTDITELRVKGQKRYLSACKDLSNGEVIAHRVARRPMFELVSCTLQVAIARVERPVGLIVHLDQAWQYKVKMRSYRAMLARCGITQSMSRKGEGFDNASIESFFGTLKTVSFHLAKFDNLSRLEAGVHDYIR